VSRERNFPVRNRILQLTAAAAVSAGLAVAVAKFCNSFGLQTDIRLLTIAVIAAGCLVIGDFFELYVDTEFVFVIFLFAFLASATVRGQITAVLLLEGLFVIATGIAYFWRNHV
jgi:hypothetical protein